MRRIFGGVPCLIAVVLLQAQAGVASLPKLQPFGVAKAFHEDSSLERALAVRGGASKSKRKSTASKKSATGMKKVGAAKEAEKEKKSALSDTLSKYKKILPLTRIYITMVGAATLLGLILGDEMTQALLAFSPTRVLTGELWRPFTAASFLGPPSIS